MESAPQHHREGIQELLDKAYDEGHRDNVAMKEGEVVEERVGHMDDKEMHGKSSQERTLSFLRDRGYLDTSFEGKEIHHLVVESLSKKEAFDRYCSSGRTSVWDGLEENMPYMTPEGTTLDVMIMKFNKVIGSDEAITEMATLGVRPLTYEELIQYGIAYPTHQEKDAFNGLGSKHTFENGNVLTPRLVLSGGYRVLCANSWDSDWSEWCRFPVVRK
ncbi:MAG: hypothetical protein A2937_02000 [Candidatus Yonathbacteria bacterium RIFCSPLOWO2_01_FULL_47_33b]|uniref:Uncharacterized protein n=1 Tax=Candidatus Yonathbacteria bacterium RIFCSPLOWO2_01_FULL_47_33b TaxID=1802727 RepID=A0A1G2SFV0_9BACT|nr:MAG: hypothetical protein A2937_02000 [Candidatus Yonathbacteria bacterium RIFCSPLOWO2_01_FULL_47_33b]